MENLTDSLVSTFLNSLDPSPVNPTKEQRYLSFLICKNLYDLCDTGRAIVNTIESKGKPIDNLPDRSNLALIQQILSKFYSDNMFVPDNEFGNRPNWSAVESFDRTRSHTAFKIYKAIHRNVVDSPGGSEIQNAIKKKDRKFFLENFDKIFANIPFKEGLLKFKNFVASPYALNADQQYVWDFFESLLDIFIYEKDNLEDLCSM